MDKEKPQPRRLLILTGPQGAGNHLFSKIFAFHPMVNGWVMNDYWEGHHHEPFAKYWDNPELLKDAEWSADRHHYVHLFLAHTLEIKNHTYQNTKSLSVMQKKYLKYRFALLEETKTF